MELRRGGRAFVTWVARNSIVPASRQQHWVMHTKHWSLLGSASTTLIALAGNCLHIRRRWPALLAALALSSLAALSAETAYQEHIKQKQSFLKDIENFNKERRDLVARQSRDRFSAREKLNAEEQAVAAELSKHVKAYFDANRNRKDFGPTLPFHAAKAEITNDGAFKLLRGMPKGALLHAHLTAVGRIDWVISNALALSNCYVYWPANPRSRGQIEFMLPQQAATNFNYVPVSKLAAQFAATNGSFGDALRAALTLGADDAVTGRRPWDELGDLFSRTGNFIRYRPIFTNYLLDAFQTLWDDGVYYVELRDSLGTLNGPGGPPDDAEKEYIEQFKAARDMMKAKHKEFDCRLVISGFRAHKADKIATALTNAVSLRKTHTNLIVGFDLIGEEMGMADYTTRVKVADVQRTINTNESYKDLVLKIPEKDLPYFLHDGESAEGDNENLVDAVILSTPRIGHAFNLYRFPALYPLIRKRDIALEICPVSNQLLGLSPDLRTHPAAGYLNAGLQCVLASDDPLWFGNDGLSYDFWEALIAWNLSLADLKKLARNSITYSGLDSQSKSNLMNHWTREWDKFIEDAAR